MYYYKHKVSAGWTFFQKLIQHLKYRGGSFGSPEFDDGFLGISCTNWMRFHSRWYDYIRRYEMFKEQTKYAFKCLFNFWKIPNALYSLTNAGYAAERIISELRTVINDKNEQIDELIEDLIEARIPDGNGIQYKSIDSDKWYRTKNTFDHKPGANNEQYFKDRGLFVFNAKHPSYEYDKEDIKHIFEEHRKFIDNKYLDDEEREQVFDDAYDAYVTSDGDMSDSVTYTFDWIIDEVDEVFYDKYKVQNEESEEWERIHKLEKEDREKNPLLNPKQPTLPGIDWQKEERVDDK